MTRRKFLGITGAISSHMESAQRLAESLGARSDAATAIYDAPLEVIELARIGATSARVCRIDSTTPGMVYDEVRRENGRTRIVFYGVDRAPVDDAERMIAGVSP